LVGRGKEEKTEDSTDFLKRLKRRPKSIRPVGDWVSIEYWGIAPLKKKRKKLTSLAKWIIGKAMP